MKLLKHVIQFNTETFTPEIVLTLSLSIEAIADSALVDHEEASRIFGQELLSIIKECIKRSAE